MAPFDERFGRKKTLPGPVRKSLAVQRTRRCAAVAVRRRRSGAEASAAGGRSQSRMPDCAWVFEQEQPRPVEKAARPSECGTIALLGGAPGPVIDSTSQ